VRKLLGPRRLKALRNELGELVALATGLDEAG
jgi:hypothetical protein